MKKSLNLIIVMLISILIFTGCNVTTTVNNDIDKDTDEVSKESVNESVYKEDQDIDSNLENENSEKKSNSNKSNEKEVEKEINLQEIKPNEAGQIMVVMYHKLSDKEAPFIRKVENFKEDLELLYQNGYRLVSLKDYINNEIDVEAGKTPVVLTFDDGNITDFNIKDEDGKLVVDPNSVVGILEEFNKKYPDFGLEATFFVNGSSTPFRQKEYVEYKMKYIIEKGMDIGNHSFGHEDLAQESKEGIQKTLAKNVEYIKQYLPDYEVNTLALPFGARPKSEEMRRFLFEGSFDGIEYNNVAALAVGWRPEYPAIHKEFDPEYINRVHGSNEEFGIRYWLEYFENHPEKRFISDGQKDVVTIPEDLEEVIDKDKIGNKELRIYNLTE